jgi:hypothetical protein
MSRRTEFLSACFDTALSFFVAFAKYTLCNLIIRPGAEDHDFLSAPLLGSPDGSSHSCERNCSTNFSLQLTSQYLGSLISSHISYSISPNGDGKSQTPLEWSRLTTEQIISVIFFEKGGGPSQRFQRVICRSVVKRLLLFIILRRKPFSLTTDACAYDSWLSLSVGQIVALVGFEEEKK